MSGTPAIIAYRPEFAALPRPDGKPIGHSAALLLSQFCWLQEHRPVEGGWIECSAEEMSSWGFTRTEQETARRVLREAGYLKEMRAGSRGRLWLSVCGKPAFCGTHQNVENPQSENQIAENLHSKPYQNAENPQTEPVQIVENLHSDDVPDCGKPALQNAENLQSKEPSVSTKSIKTPEELAPPISPPQAGGKRARPAFVAPTSDEVQAYVVGELKGSIADADKFYDHFSANGWRMRQGPIKDWRAAARNWLRRALEWDKEHPARGSPLASPPPPSPPPKPVKAAPPGQRPLEFFTGEPPPPDVMEKMAQMGFGWRGKRTGEMTQLSEPGTVQKREEETRARRAAAEELAQRARERE